MIQKHTVNKIVIRNSSTRNQWLNRGGAGGQSAPRDFWPGNFSWPAGEKRGKVKMEKGKMEKKRRKIVKVHFSKRLKFVLGLPKWKFLPGKNHFTPGKKSGNINCPPPPKSFPVTPLLVIIFPGPGFQWYSAFKLTSINKCTVTWASLFEKQILTDMENSNGTTLFSRRFWRLTMHWNVQYSIYHHKSQIHKQVWVITKTNRKWKGEIWEGKTTCL